MSKGDDLTKILDQKQNVSEARIMNDSFVQKLENLEVFLEKIRMDLECKYSLI